MPHFIKTGFWALEQRAPKGWLNLEDIMGGGGGASVITLTYTALQSLITGNQLVPGSIYKITGFNKNMPNGSPENPNGNLPVVLYNDGTNSGITIYLQAITSNTLAESGHGEFYNPKYGDRTTYDNTDGTGLYGIWDGDNPDEDDQPTYQVNQVVFWGGYAWRNLLGNTGSPDNVLTLNSDNWQKLPYSNTTYYEKVIDEIKVDLNNGILIGRTNIENQITVEFNADQYDWEMGLGSGISSNPIAVMGWGLYSKVTPEGLTNGFYGISNVKVINSVCETVNFKGELFINVEMNSSFLNNNYFGKNSQFDYNTLTSINYVSSNTLMRGSYIRNNILTDNSGIVNNTLTNNSGIIINTLTSSYISSNTLSGGTVDGSSYPTFIALNILNSSGITDNNISITTVPNILFDTDIGINFNTLMSGSNIKDNNLESSMIAFNKLDTFSSIGTDVQNNVAGNTLSDNSSIIRNQLISGSYIGTNTLTLSLIFGNTLISGSQIQLSTSGTLTGKSLGAIRIDNTVLDEDLSAATDIFLSTDKTIFTRLDGTKRLSYYNTSDTPTIVNVNA